jgi:alpha-galactosidase
LIEKAKVMLLNMLLFDGGRLEKKYPRNDDTQKLGDWKETKEKF